jgi:hypothetical protein
MTGRQPDDRTREPGALVRRLDAEREASGMLADLTALTPPFLVCAAFLTAVAAFLRHEMRAAKKQDDDQSGDVDEPSRTGQVGDQGSGPAH